MQDRYVGDIGDFVKFAILRALTPRRTVGVAWWLYPDESHNSDGRHVNYLDRPGTWRALDEELFDALGRIVASGDRRVAALEAANLLPGATFSNEIIPVEGKPAERAAARVEWLGRVNASLRECEIVFLDPDNGLETSRYSPAAKKAGKCVSLNELRQLSEGDRTLIVYHHQTRRPGGHMAEIFHWRERLRGVGFRTVDAIRARPYSPRAFFILNAGDELRSRAERLAIRWDGLLSWHPARHA